MIVLIQSGNDQMVFDNVHRIEERTRPSIFDENGRKVVNLFDEEGNVLMGGDDIDSMSTRLTVLPNAERE
jgi:hypothetical protein